MAEDNCTYRNPLKRDGVSQKQRVPGALDPDYVNVDERSLADLLRFVNQYAKLLQYYKVDGTPDGDWGPFFEKDVTSIMVMLTDENPAAFINCLQEAEAIIKDDYATFREIRRAFKTLFDISATLAVEIDHWYRQSVKEFGFHSHLERVIISELRPSLIKLTGFYKGALTGTPLLIENFVAGEEKCGRELLSFPELSNHTLDKLWIDHGMADADENITTWPSFYNVIGSDTSVYKTDSTAIKARVREAFPVIRDLVRSFIGAIQTTKQRIPEFVEQTLASFSAHEPHMGLLLTFFKLFTRAQDQINSITGRHLNFYYEKVLQLVRHDAIPDQVHLILELAKHVDSHKIDKGTLFKAGKDILGKELLYRANEEVVLNKAKVLQLKSLFIDKSDQHRIYGKPVANSEDGLGKELDNPSAGWKAFGETQLLNIDDDGNKEYKSPEEVTMQFSSVGFAIASPLLDLAEGDRIITMEVAVANDTVGPGSVELTEGVEYSDLLRFYLTGPEGWINLQEFETTPTVKRNGSTYIIELPVIREVPSICGYNEEMHGTGYQTTHPIIKVVLANNRNTGIYAYHFLRNKRVDRLEISVTVNGLKNLVIQNELGTLDPAKPFQPFGPAPTVGSAFYVGSREVFSKHLDSISVVVEWHDYPNERLSNYYNYDATGTLTGAKATNRTPLADSDFKADLEILDNGSWQPVKSSINIFPAQLSNRFNLINKAWSGTGADDDTNNFAIGWAPALDSFSEFNVNLNRGFLRLVLSVPQNAFGHKIYPRLLMQQLQENGDIPVEPYTPKINSITLNYSASIEMNERGEQTNSGEDQLYHLYPFGTCKVFEGNKHLDELYVLPKFSHAGELGEIDHEGEFYIGIYALQPPQQISLLIKMAEGSGNPSLNPPEINWFYLSASGWISFKNEDILVDGTNGLLDTGILRFNIPEQATSETTLLPGECHWIKAAVNQNAGALSRIIDLHSQVLSASFLDQNNAPEFLSNALPAGTISKLKQKQSQVKNIQQPYASENGKIAEQDREYYRRVSERLRHKDRGISVRDYERIVLQEFPSVYKAKCINHTVYDLEMNGTKMDAEFAPGYVTLVVVPDLSNKNAFNQLEPRVSLDLIKQISCFLKKKISLFAAENISVINPYFEQVQLVFNVVFTAGKDEGYYRKKLVEDITAFLSSWAFEESEDILFGGSMHKSVILNYVEEQPYVDYVTDFKMNHLIEGKSIKQNTDEIFTSQARSVLVSYHTHNINNQSIKVL